MLEGQGLALCDHKYRENGYIIGEHLLFNAIKQLQQVDVFQCTILTPWREFDAIVNHPIY